MNRATNRATRRTFLLGLSAAGALPLLAACGAAATPTPQPAAKAAEKIPPPTVSGPAGETAKVKAIGSPTAAAKAAEATKPAAKPGEPTKPAKPAAAAKPDAKPAAELPTPVPGKVNVRFFTGEDDPPQMKIYADAIAEYEKQNPNVKVSVSPSPDDVLQKLTASIAAKTVPEFTTLTEADIMELAARGFLEPVDPIVQEIGKDDFKPNSLYSIKGKVYNMPYAGGGYGQVWYRTDLFDEAGIKPPTNWDEWKAAAQKLNKGGVAGFTVPGAKGGSLNVFTSQLIWSNGGTFFDEKLNVAINTTSKDAIKGAMEFYKELSEFSPAGWPQYDWDGTIDSFLTKKSAMIFYAGRPLGRAAQNAPDLVPVMKAFRLPQSRAGLWGHYDHYDSYAAFKKEFGSNSPEEALKFMKFITTGDQAVKFLHTVPGHLSPALFSIDQNPKLWEHPLMKSHRDSVELVFRPNGLYYLTEAGAKPNAEKVMVSQGIFNLYGGPPAARSLQAEMMQRFALQNQPPEQAIQWAHNEFSRLTDDMKKRIKPEEFGYTGG